MTPLRKNKIIVFVANNFEVLSVLKLLFLIGKASVLQFYMRSFKFLLFRDYKVLSIR